MVRELFTDLEKVVSLEQIPWDLNHQNRPGYGGQGGDLEGKETSILEGFPVMEGLFRFKQKRSQSDSIRSGRRARVHAPDRKGE